MRPTQCRPQRVDIEFLRRGGRLSTCHIGIVWRSGAGLIYRNKLYLKRRGKAPGSAAALQVYAEKLSVSSILTERPTDPSVWLELQRMLLLCRNATLKACREASCSAESF